MENTNENGAAVARESIELRDIGGALQITIGGEAYRRLECVARAFNRFNAKYKCWSGEDDTPLTAFNAFCVFDGFGDFAQGVGYVGAVREMVQGLDMVGEWCTPDGKADERRRRRELVEMITDEIKK